MHTRIKTRLLAGLALMGPLLLALPAQADDPRFCKSFQGRFDRMDKSDVEGLKTLKEQARKGDLCKDLVKALDDAIANPPKPVVVAPLPPSGPSPEDAAWTRARTSDRLSDYQAFLRSYPQSAYAPAARAAIARIETAAEQKRIADAEAARPKTTSQPKLQPETRPVSPPPPPPINHVDARTTPSTTRAPLFTGDPARLPDFALFRECEGCPEMVVIPGGSFTMGSTDGESDEQPTRTVSIRRFAISRFETTWDEWDACVSVGACNAAGPQGAGGDNGWGKGRRPVIGVDWNDARAYAGFVSGRSPGDYRLPSEAEWEYAARAGNAAAYSWGSSSPTCDPQARNGANFDACSDDRTRAVGSFRASPWGLFDMAGNVREWVEDCYADSYAQGQPNDGTAFTKGSCSNRVSRGGGWVSDPTRLRSAYRFRNSPTVRSNYLGFRVTRTL